MISAATRRAFSDYAEKRTTFDQFARVTQDFWTAAARYLLSRWRASEAVEPKDLVQELLLEAWRSFPLHDPARGDLTDFISYQAISRAKRWLHGQRGRRKCSRSDKAASRHPIRFCDVKAVSSKKAGDTDSEIAEFLEIRLGALDAVQERVQDLNEVMDDTVRMVQEIIRRPHRDDEVRLLHAYVEAEGNIIRALEILHGDISETERGTLEEKLLKSVARAIERRRFERTVPDADASVEATHPLSNEERRLLMEIDL